MVHLGFWCVQCDAEERVLADLEDDNALYINSQPIQQTN